MDSISVLIDYLKSQKEITDLEKDILDTWNELVKKPLDMSSAERQVRYNDIAHMDIFLAIAAMPSTVPAPAGTTYSEADLIYNLNNQLKFLAEKELEALSHGQQT